MVRKVDFVIEADRKRTCIFDMKRWL